MSSSSYLFHGYHAEGPQRPIELATIKQKNSRKKIVKTEKYKITKSKEKQLTQLGLNQTITST